MGTTVRMSITSTQYTTQHHVQAPAPYVSEVHGTCLYSAPPPPPPPPHAPPSNQHASYTLEATPPPPPPPPPHNSEIPSTIGVVNPGGELSLAQRVADVAAKLDLESAMVSDLLQWAGTEVIVIADDSGSMNHVTNSSLMATRWDELKLRLGQLLDILLLVDDGKGFELRFLNRGRPVMIRSHQELQACWQWAQPGGRTPLGAVMKDYLRPTELETDRLVMVMTDGSPSDVTFEQLRGMIQRKSEGVYVSVMMCTEEDDVVEQYNAQVDPLPGVDVLDDYVSEKKEIEARGKRFSLNMYLVKSVLGPKYSRWDKMDEAPTAAGCKCSIM